MRDRRAKNETDYPYEQWLRQLERFVVSRLGDAQLAEEIAQESIVRFLTASQRGVDIDRPEPWLFRTARNLAIDIVRRKLPSPIGLEALARIPDERGIDDDERFDTRVGEIGRGEVLKWIPQLVSSLSKRDQALLKARYERGLSCQELADTDQITLDNAKVRLYRARQRLLRAVEDRLREDWGASL